MFHLKKITIMSKHVTFNYSLKENLNYLLSQCRPGSCDYDDGYYDAINKVKELLGYE